MKPVIVCSAADRALWLEHRRKYITSSDIAVFLGIQPSWWSFSSRQSILEEKMGADNYQPNNNTEHGIFNEECNRLKTEKLLGMTLPQCQQLVTNEQWPHLAATPDCYALPGPLGAPYKLLTSHPVLVDVVREEVASQSRVGGCQLKSTDSPKAVHYGKRGFPQGGEKADWITHAPPYHMPQLQTEMYIMDWDWSILSGQLGAHNLVVWFVERDPAWKSIMDEAEKQAAEVFGQIARKERVSL
jgi:hypothetical protein